MAPRRKTDRLVAAEIAALLKEVQPSQLHSAYGYWESTCWRFARGLLHHNPNFNSGRFLVSCGMDLSKEEPDHHED